jgi:hypothetical protein
MFDLVILIGIFLTGVHMYEVVASFTDWPNIL